MKKVLAIAVVSITALTAQAGITTTFVKTYVGAVEEGGEMFNIYEMQVTTDTDWTNSRLEIALSAGSFGNHALGSHFPPPIIEFPPGPELANDSYLQTPTGYSPAIGGTLIFPMAVPKGDTEVAVSWYDVVDTGAGTHTIAQLALSKDAVGTVVAKSYDISVAGRGCQVGDCGPEVFGRWVIGPDPSAEPYIGAAYLDLAPGEFHWVPEPATGSLLLLGGLSFLVRRRR